MNLYSLQPAAIRFGQLLRPVYFAIYAIGRWRFLSLTRSLHKESPKLAAVYLRGSAVEEGLEPAFSDWNWVLIFENMPGDTEMEAVKELWGRFEKLKKYFPFISEPRVMNVSDFTNWTQQPLQELQEVRKWRLEWGRDLRPKHFPEPAPEDVFRSLLGEWWLICQALVKIEWFTQNEVASPSVRIRLRNAAKALADFRRIRNPDLSRSEALGELAYLLRPYSQLPDRSEVWDHFTEAALECLKILERFAVEAPKHTFIVPHRLPPEEAPDDLALRELYAEKMVFTSSLRRALVSHWDSHVWLEFADVPDLPSWRDSLLQARDTGFSFDRKGTTVFLGPKAGEVLQSGYLATLPFHDWGAHTEIVLSEETGLASTLMEPAPSHLSAPMIFRALHDLGIEVRSRPKEDPRHFRERILGLALALRASATGQGARTDNVLHDFEKIQPLRARVVREKFGATPPDEDEAPLWSRLQHLQENLESIDSHRAKGLQFSKIQVTPYRSPRSLWVELSPFLRAETNALRDRVSAERPALQL